MYIDEETRKILEIRYVKLHFTLTLSEDCELPQNKVSALRGGIGEMLLRANCIRDRKCEGCDFKKECIVQRTMYSQYEIIPQSLSVNPNDSIGYVLECENYETQFCAGSTLEFNLILFGKTIVYLNQYMQALYALGQNGIGKNKSRFYISEVTNTKRERILDGNNIYMGNYTVQTLYDYVNYRLSSVKNQSAITGSSIQFKTPVTLKHNGEFLQEFDSEIILNAVKRRLYLLGCFEGIDCEAFYNKTIEIPGIIQQEHSFITVNRYSSRQDSKMSLKGIKGSYTLDAPIGKAMPVMLAGELIHIGKNTSFGFGRYRVL